MNKYRKGFYGILLLTLTMLFGMTAQAKTDDTIKTGIYAAVSYTHLTLPTIA